MEIELENIAKFYKKGKAYYVILNTLNYKFEKGKFYFIRGPQGSGKTTLLKILAMRENIIDGHLYIDGKDVKKLNLARRAHLRKRNIGVIFQQPELSSTLTLYENIKLPTFLSNGISKDKNKEQLEYLIKRYQLEEKLNYFPHELSSAELQKASVVRALVNDPDIIIADEPLQYLSYSSQVFLLIHLKQLASQGKTVIIASKSQLPKKFANVNLEIKNKRLIEVNK